MSNDVIVALIALGAALLSGFTSWAVGRHQAKSELEKIRMELRHVYATNLQEKRMEVFPELYRLLSALAKQIQFREAERRHLEEFRSRVDEWDSCYSVFLGIYATETLYEFRQHLYHLLTAEENDLPRLLEEEFIGYIEKMEMTVKADLGVFSLAFYDPEREWTDYNEVQDALRKRMGKPK